MQTIPTTMRLSAVIGAALTALACQESWQVPNSFEHPPLREVARSAKLPQSVFDEPAIVLIAKVSERVELEETTFEGESLIPPRYWTAVKAGPHAIIRLNERKKTDPDLSRGFCMVEQKDRGQQPLRFEFGRYYLLLLNPSSTMYRGAPAATISMDWYAFAVPQGGFEIVNGRLLPLTAGGELDAYKGRLADDVIKEIRAGQ